MRLLTPRHWNSLNSCACVRAEAPRAKANQDICGEDTLLSVEDALANGDAKQRLAQQLQDSMLASDTMISTAPEGNGGPNGTFIASSAPQWMVCITLNRPCVPHVPLPQHSPHNSGYLCFETAKAMKGETQNNIHVIAGWNGA
jgi:hypothetical protein